MTLVVNINMEPRCNKNYLFFRARDENQKYFYKSFKRSYCCCNHQLRKDNIGKKIDVRARKFLKKDNLDYAHGTGHGVGFFLNVHEGPQAISKFNNVKLQEGMILSNEPGYYKKNKFGIRIENLVFIKRDKKQISFEELNTCSN